jgi:hypothetical protein
MAPIFNINIFHCQWIMLLFIKIELNALNNSYASNLNHVREARKESRMSNMFLRSCLNYEHWNRPKL